MPPPFSITLAREIDPAAAWTALAEDERQKRTRTVDAGFEVLRVAIGLEVIGHVSDQSLLMGVWLGWYGRLQRTSRHHALDPHAEGSHCMEERRLVANGGADQPHLRSELMEKKEADPQRSGLMLILIIV